MGQAGELALPRVFDPSPYTRSMKLSLVAIIATVVFGAACQAEEGTMSDGDLTLSSDAFGANERIPAVHAYAPEGDNVSPALAWSGAPAGTKELALIVDDPDAPRAEPWVHWVLYRIPAAAEGLPAGASRGIGHLTEPGGALEGKNDFGDLGWGGPLPPRGHGTHHYHFKLYALDAPLALGEGATKAKLLKALEGHVLAQAELVGTYSR
jgi:Raf kinase inhibitor-like YbhB/YbcL family protein